MNEPQTGAQTRRRLINGKSLELGSARLGSDQGPRRLLRNSGEIRKRRLERDGRKEAGRKSPQRATKKENKLKK